MNLESSDSIFSTLAIIHFSTFLSKILANPGHTTAAPPAEHAPRKKGSHHALAVLTAPTLFPLDIEPRIPHSHRASGASRQRSQAGQATRPPSYLAQAQELRLQEMPPAFCSRLLGQPPWSEGTCHAQDYAMRLTELEPRFLRYEEQLDTWAEVDRQPLPGESYESVPHHQVTGMRAYFPFVEKIEDAQGVEFLCPKCFVDNGGRVGTHAVICWSSSRGVPEKASPGPGRWRLVGTGFDDLSLMEEPGKSRSVLLLGGCAWHGFITNGEVT